MSAFRPFLLLVQQDMKTLIDVRRKFSKLASYHVLGYGKIEVVLPVVYLELQADKIWQYRSRARLCLDRRRPFARLLLYYGEAFDMIRMYFAGLDCGGLRNDIGAWRKVS
jgi:hypothetical protein